MRDVRVVVLLVLSCVACSVAPDPPAREDAGARVVDPILDPSTPQDPSVALPPCRGDQAERFVVDGRTVSVAVPTPCDVTPYRELGDPPP